MARSHEILNKTHIQNQVWTLVELPSDCKVVENKWVFKKKTDADGKVSVYKV